MKTALCISGHIRSFLDVYDTLYRYILEPYSPDVFIHTWDTIGFFTRGKKIKGHRVKMIQDDTVSPLLWSEVLEKLQPVAIYQENQRTVNLRYFDKEEYTIRAYAGMPSNYAYNLYSIQKANDLRLQHQKIQGFEYDFVIRTRFDLEYQSNLHIDDLDVQSGSLFYPSYRNGVFPELRDVFVMGSSLAVNAYANTFSHIKEYLTTGCNFSAESLINRSLYNERITTVRVPIQFRIKRQGIGNYYELTNPWRNGEEFAPRLYILKTSKIEKITDFIIDLIQRTDFRMNRDQLFIHTSANINNQLQEFMRLHQLFKKEYTIDSEFFDGCFRSFQHIKVKT